MSSTAHRFNCDLPTPDTEEVKSLRVHGANRNVHLRIENIQEAASKALPKRLRDLVEIASYVYAADQAVSRGGEADRNVGASWHRSFHLTAGVRDAKFWNNDRRSGRLSKILEGLSSEDWAFDFQPRQDRFVEQQYFHFGDNWLPSVDCVILFSGGLDSFAGVLHAVASGCTRIVLVTHWSTPKSIGPTSQLVRDLNRALGSKVHLHHIPVSVSKFSKMTKDSNQRTRSLLFASLGMVVAKLFGCPDLRMYENGVVSINLPISDQLIGARASRSTYPCVMEDMDLLFKDVGPKGARLRNPFLWMTKKEVVESILAAGHEDLIESTHSCGDTRRRTGVHPHCGVCSQCIDRQFAMIAADAEEHDPAERYETQLWDGARESNRDRTMLESYVRSALNFAEMDDVAFFSKYAEVQRVLMCLDGSSEESARRILDLHRRHGVAVRTAVESGLQARATQMLRNDVAIGSLLSLVRSRLDKRSEDTFAWAKTRDQVRPLAKRDYGTLVESSGDYDLFVDGCDRQVHRKTGRPGGRPIKLTGGQLRFLLEFVRQDAMVDIKAAHRDLIGDTSDMAAIKFFAGLRKIVDSQIGRDDWRCFKRVMGGAKGARVYRFDPDPEFKYCIVWQQLNLQDS